MPPKISLVRRAQFFEAARPHLQGDKNGRPYEEIAVELGMSEGALRVAVHRLRRRYGELLRAEIARTLDDPEQVGEELRNLREILRKAG